MTLRDLMTSNPAYCLPSDSVANAAQVMKREDIGPVLVVSDPTEKRLVGIVTDRDLAISIVAEGRDPHSTRVDQVMTSNPVTAHESDGVSAALKKMAEHQVRRLPITDRDGRLVGIVAQADLARNADEEQVGEMVEEISQPYGMGDWPEGKYDYEDRAEMSTATAMAIGAACLGLGAGLMYLLDPERGRRRRAEVRNKAVHYGGASREAMRRSASDLGHRARGVYSETRSRISQQAVPDEKLRERVRSKMGRCVSHPHAIQVTADSGHVTVSGPILSDEAHELIRCIRRTPGVQSVDNRLELHDASENHPSLQGTGKERTASAMNWRPGSKLLAGALGGGMAAAYGLKSRLARH